MRKTLLGMFGLVVAGSMLAAQESEKKEAPKTKGVRIGVASWQIPANWKAEQPKREFRIAQWALPKTEGDERAPEFYVSRLTSGGGGVEANIERWIGQFDDQRKEPKRDKFEAAGHKIYTVDISGTYKESMGGPFAQGKATPRKDYRMLGAVVVPPPDEDDGIYFFRMTGPAKSVEAQAKAFTEMLKSASK